MTEGFLAAAWRENRVWPILLFLLLLINIGLYAWITYRFSPTVENLERSYIAAQAEARQGAQREKMTTPGELFERAGNDLRAFRQAIPAQNEFTGLIEEVFTLAAESGLSIDRIGYSPEQEKESGLLRYGLSFAVAGDYGQVKNFIASLEQSSRIIAIEEISLSGNENQEIGAVNLHIRLATYFRAERS